MKIELQHVHYMPKDLKPGVLYVSEEFGIAAHLCGLDPFWWRMNKRHFQDK